MIEDDTITDEGDGEHMMLSSTQITTVYQAACLVLTAHEDLIQVRASHASPPSQWPPETQVSGWPREARDAYNAAMGHYGTVLNHLVELVPESLAPLHFAHGSQHLLRVAYEDVQGDPRGGTVIAVVVYPLLHPEADRL